MKTLLLIFLVLCFAKPVYAQDHTGNDLFIKLLVKYSEEKQRVTSNKKILDEPFYIIVDEYHDVNEKKVIESELLSYNFIFIRIEDVQNYYEKHDLKSFKRVGPIHIENDGIYISIVEYLVIKENKDFSYGLTQGFEFKIIPKYSSEDQKSELDIITID